MVACACGARRLAPRVRPPSGVCGSPSSFDNGQPAAIVATGATANATAIVNFGDGNTSLGGAPLPLSSAPFGAPGCFLNASVLASLKTIADANGVVRLGFTVPNSLFGFLQRSRFQIGTMTSANALGLVTTEALEIR